MLNKGFMAGTVVWVPDGWVAIERIRVGDRVLARDASSSVVAYRAVMRIFDVPRQDMILVRFHQDGPGDDSMRIDTLATTAGQSFFVNVESGLASGWRTAGHELDCGDRIPVAKGADARVICADALLETGSLGVAWSMKAWGPEQNDGSGYLADMRRHPPEVSNQESFNWGEDGGLITQSFQAPAIGIVVEEFHSLFVGTIGACAHDAS